MTIIYPLTLPPAPAPRSARLVARNAVGLTESPFSGVQQVQAHAAQRWGLTLEWPLMTRAQAAPLLASLIALKGRLGTFFYGDPDAALPQGAAAANPGTPRVNGAGQGGAQLALDGAPANVANWLMAGDYVQLGAGAAARLHRVVENASTDAQGQAILSLWPDLRDSPADEQAVVVINPVAAFRLAGNETPWESDARGLLALAIEAIEAI